ncbi:MAG: ATP-binding cassette domain-containing protein [Chloroflexi bacterium]|jgi:ATP-binding cassette subfamily B protein|nr:ATP-binding cassette domain-containing protein [Chloroflexota bacterium]
MGFFSGLDREAYDREYSDRELLQRIFAYFRPHRKRVLGVGAVIMVGSLISALQPVAVARALDLLVVDRRRLDVFIAVVAFMLVYGVVNWGVNWVRRRVTGMVIADIVSTLRTDAFAASVRHDLSFFDEFRSGRIISRITSDTEEFARVVQLVTDLIGRVIEVLILLGYLFSVSWRLTLLLVGMAPIVVGIAMAFRRLARRVTRKGFQVLAEVNASIQEAVTGISVAKNFRQEANIYEEFSEVNRQSYHVNLRRGYALALTFPALNAISGVGTAVLVYFGGLPAAMGSISVGSWYLFVSSLDRFWFPMISLSAFWSQFQGGLSASERVFALIDAEPTVRQEEEASVEALKGEILFDHVDFRYTEQERVLEDFTLHIEPGESVALVGHTGAGKSSIAKLIARFYEFQDGRILIDGRDLRTFDLHEYRQQLGMVSQMPFLFTGTVADNIRYGRPGISDEKILAMARQIGEGGWLETLPNGLETEVGERGGKLSMGQRQLVALLRVLVQEPAIFILDEATASIDPFTEMQIQEATDLILQQSTSILIAHRLSTIRAVDRIIVLREGQIIEEGDHDALMAQGGHYAELYNTYFRHQSLSYVEEVGWRKKQRAGATA